MEVTFDHKHSLFKTIDNLQVFVVVIKVVCSLDVLLSILLAALLAAPSWRAQYDIRHARCVKLGGEK